ncbi:unnamed protein product [Schistosoma margrebowiei]|uniref:Uncharacterized protein n=2 Tax=Schistosoma TaxID=6181 RepID=A0A183LNA1_9TREM|nr:unnamed protein product [Schistosoma margrebowiei]
MGCNEFLDVDVVDELQSYIERQIHSVESKKNFNSVTALGGGKLKVRITCSVYAWAREQSGANFNDHQICSDLRKNRLRLCQKLSRLVRLSKSSKEQSQRHPLLVSLRHDLTKIRLRATGKVFTEKPVITTLPSDSTFASFEKPIIQSKLAVVFERLADQITDLLLPISHLIPGVELLPGGSLVDLEYADDIVLFGEDADKMQSLLTTLSNNASMFGMRFSPSKCKMLLQDWVTSTPELVIGSEVVECVDRFTYLGSLISPCGLVCDEISARIQKARLAFANLRHLWRRRDIRLSTKGRVYCAAVRSVLLYGCISIVKCADDAAKRRENLRAQVILAIHGFYCHFNEITEDNTYEFKQNNSVMNDDPMNGSYDLSDRSESSSDDDDITGAKETNVEGRLNNDISMESDSEIIRTEEDEIKGKETEENNRIDADKEKHNKTIQHFNKSTKSHSNSSKVSSSGFTRKHTNRSLRLRHSRTPSDASCSEGEVLSDTEEDHDLTDNDVVDEKDIVAVQEKVKSISETNCDHNENLVRLVHNSLQANTPISDVDLTELEIMDEWGPPTSVNRLDTSIALSDISLPAEKELMVVGGSRQETLDPGFVLLGTRQQGVPVILRELVLPDGFDLVSPSFTVRDNLITTDEDDKITDLFNESLEFCAKHLHDLIIIAETNCHLMRKPIKINKQNDINQTTINNQLQPNFCLSSELEASIDRTATAFKEHINSVLTNLLHTASISKSSNDGSKSRSQRTSTITSARRQNAPSRRGSRLRGMLLAYQQDAVKKRLSSNNSE